MEYEVYQAPPKSGHTIRTKFPTKLCDVLHSVLHSSLSNIVEPLQQFVIARGVIGATTAISGGAQRQGIRTWHFLWNFECGASWTAVALYLPPKAELFFGLRGLGVAQPGRRVAAQGGAQWGGTPAPANFAQLLGGRRPLGLPEGPNRPKNGSLWASGGSEISSRRADRATTT